MYIPIYATAHVHIQCQTQHKSEHMQYLCSNTPLCNTMFDIYQAPIAVLLNIPTCVMSKCQYPNKLKELHLSQLLYHPVAPVLSSYRLDLHMLCKSFRYKPYYARCVNAIAKAAVHKAADACRSSSIVSATRTCVQGLHSIKFTSTCEAACKCGKLTCTVQTCNASVNKCRAAKLTSNWQPMLDLMPIVHLRSHLVTCCVAWTCLAFALGIPGQHLAQLLSHLHNSFSECATQSPAPTMVSRHQFTRIAHNVSYEPLYTSH